MRDGDPDSLVGELLTRLIELEDAGHTIRIVEMDVSDAAQVARARSGAQ